MSNMFQLTSRWNTDIFENVRSQTVDEVVYLLLGSRFVEEVVLSVTSFPSLTVHHNEFVRFYGLCQFLSDPVWQN